MIQRDAMLTMNDIKIHFIKFSKFFADVLIACGVPIGAVVVRKLPSFSCNV